MGPGCLGTEEAMGASGSSSSSRARTWRGEISATNWKEKKIPQPTRHEAGTASGAYPLVATRHGVRDYRMFKSLRLKSSRTNKKRATADGYSEF